MAWKLEKPASGAEIMFRSPIAVAEVSSFVARRLPLMNTKHSSLFPNSCSLALFCLVVANPSYASQAVGWWGGNWTCNIDGRPARMKWTVVDDSQTTANDDGTATTTSGVRWKGSFSDNGSNWVPLTNPRLGTKGGMYFNHADGNRWYLSKPSSNKSTGWTTWDDQRYPLSCWK